MPTDSEQGQTPTPQESSPVTNNEHAQTQEVPLHPVDSAIINMTNGAPVENPYVQKLSPKDLTPIGSNTPLDINRINETYTPPAIPNENSYPKPLDITEAGNNTTSIIEPTAQPAQADEQAWHYQPKTTFTSQAIPMPQAEQPAPKQPQAFKPERPSSLVSRLVTNHSAALAGIGMLAAVGTTMDQNGEAQSVAASTINEPETSAPAPTEKSFWEQLGLDKIGNIFSNKKAEPMQQITQQTQSEVATTQSADLVRETAEAARTETLTAEQIALAANAPIKTQPLQPIAQELAPAPAQPDSIVGSQSKVDTQPTTIFSNTPPNTFGGK